MKKKLLVALLAATAAVCGSFGLSACNNDNNEHGASEWGDEYSVQSAYALAKDLGYTGTLEEFIATISGKDGADGVGIDNAYIDDEGCLILVLTDKKTINCGKISTSVVENQNFQYVTLKENNAVTGYAIAGIKTGTVIDSDLIIPSTYQDKPVKEIAQDAFKDCKHFTSVTIPASVITIGNSAFSGCNSIEEIKYVGNIESWCKISGLYTLMCNGTTDRKLFIDGAEVKGNLAIPTGVTAIGDYAFYGCSSVTNLTIPNGVTSIGKSAFSGCSSVTNLTIPNGVTSIGNSAFYGCSSLKSLTIPNSVKTIGNSAFSGCSAVTSLVIPTGVTAIGDYAFDGCSSITNLTIPNTVTEIGRSAFYNCSSLESITIPFVGATKDGTKNTHFGYIFGASAYYYNEDFVPASLKTVIITGGETISESTFYKCSNIVSVTIPNSVNTIGYSAFENCSSLESITIPFVGATKDGTKNTHFGYIFGASAYYNNGDFVPASLKTVIITGGEAISERTFYGCSNIVSVTIPNSVTQIGSSAFCDCIALTRINFEGTYTQWVYSVTKGGYWDSNTGDYIVHCIDDDIAQS